MLKFQMMLDACLVVGRQRHDQRSLATQVDQLAGQLFQFRGKIRPQRLAAAAERDQLLLPGLGLGARRKHARGSMARARPGRGPVEQGDGGTALGEPPGDPKPDDAGADDQRRWCLGRSTMDCGHRRLPTLACPRQVRWV